MGKAVATAVLSLVLATTTAMGMEHDNGITLSAPATDGDVSVEAALDSRRSEREYASRPLSLSDVAQLLWAAQGVTDQDGGRTAPSAGALYPLELYLVAGHVDSLPAGVYRYEPGTHRLHPVADGDRRKPLAQAAVGQAWVRRAPAVLVIAGVYERTASKYGQRARRYVHIEVGHAAQNVYLQAEALDLATVIVGAFDDDEVHETLGLPADHAPLALLPVGHPR